MSGYLIPNLIIIKTAPPEKESSRDEEEDAVQDVYGGGWH